MSLAAAVETAIRQCGGEVTLIHNGRTDRFYASIQPRSYDTQTATRPAGTSFGQTDPREFVYFGPLTDGGERVTTGAVLQSGGRRYLVRIWHDFSCGGNRLYRWAALRQMEEEESNGSTDQLS